MFTPDAVLLFGLALLLALGLAALRFGRRPPPKRCQEPFAAQRLAGGFPQKAPAPLSSVAGQRSGATPPTVTGPAPTERPASRLTCGSE